MHFTKAVGDDNCLGPRAILQGVADIHAEGRSRDSSWQKAMPAVGKYAFKVFVCVYVAIHTAKYRVLIGLNGTLRVDQCVLP